MEDTNKQRTFTRTLKSLGIGASCTSYSDYIGAETYDIKLEPTSKISSLRAKLGELQLALKASVSTLSVLTEEGILRLELPKKVQPPLNLFEYGSQVSNSNELVCLLGRTLLGEPVWLDVANAPHTIVGGTTGSGKSTLIHSILANLLMKGDVSCAIFDPKGIDFAPYEGRTTVIYDYDGALNLVDELVDEMNRRYQDIRDGHKDFPYIVLIIDEFADLLAQDYDKSLYKGIRLLAQKARAAKIHVIAATQRPSAGILDGTLKANFPTRIACRVANTIDSRVILDEGGAEKLPTHGMAIIKQGGKSVKFQVAFTTADEVVGYLGKQRV